LSANWSADNKLTLTSAGDFYIAGELTPYKAGGFAAANVSPFGPARDIGNVKALDREKVD
jgi:hypothetical protein